VPGEGPGRWPGAACKAEPNPTTPDPGQTGRADETSPRGIFSGLGTHAPKLELLAPRNSAAAARYSFTEPVMPDT
jgi:hypothetical protein